MLDIILLLSVSPVAGSLIQPVAQVQPCVWPNPCAQSPVFQVAGDYEICMWPRKCGARAAAAAAQIEPCVLPNRCGGLPA